VNSINWGRIAAQVVYYAHASLSFRAQTGAPAVFSVPTGNFGNVYAGFIARALGFPIDRLIIATNTNDILYRFFQGGEMKKSTVTPTLSPSMDIQVSSNFERLVFDMLRHDGTKTAQLFKQFQEQGAFTLPPDIVQSMRGIFSAARADDALTLETIGSFYKKHGYVLDPHTAVGIAAAQSTGGAVITLATAHPAKFPDAVAKATGTAPQLPAHMQDLFTRTEHYEKMPNDRNAVQAAIISRFGA
jgi:threonine synthase